MGQIEFSTASLPQADRGHAWADMVEQHLNAIEVRVRDQSAFNGKFAGRRVGDNKLVQVWADYQQVRRNPSRHETALSTFNLIYVMDGHIELRSNFRTGVVPQGDWVLLSNQDRYEFETSSACSCFLVYLAGDWLKTFLPDPDRALEGQPHSAGNWHHSLGYGLRALAENRAEARDGAGMDQIGGLLALACDQVDAGDTTHRTALRRRAVSLMRSLHHRPDLRAGHIAAELNISERYLHSIMAGADASFGSELRGIRLAKAAAMLRSSAFSGKQVGEIAASVGLVDHVHFTKRFRDAYGVTPREYREGADQPALAGAPRL